MIQQLKRDFRAAMNGVASKAMRDAGMNFHVIFGIELPRLMEIAKDYPHDRSLAQQLWHENVRESKIMAILLTPPQEFLPEVADIWLHEATTQELVSLISMHLITPQSWASDWAFRWIARAGKDNYLVPLCGWLTLCRLLRQGATLLPRSEAELRDHANSLPPDSPIALRKAVAATIAELG